jgi:uncharacterized membrane protein YcaP (DUF421 family)
MDWSWLHGDPSVLIGDGNGDILWWQMCLRAGLVLLFGLVAIRLLGRSAFGKQTTLDIIVAIVTGSNLSRALTGNAPLLPTFAATLLLLLAYWLLGHLAARSHRFSRLVNGDPIPLVRSGRLDLRRMTRAGISAEDIAESARRTGLGGLHEVDQAVLERSGKISTTRR